MNYAESLSYLRGTNRAFCKPGTERVEALCAAVEKPQKNLPVIHVTGTNGKGSFCVILASLLEEAGFTVGRFSSPALCKINECIAVNGTEISDDDFARLVSLIRPYADAAADRPTEFEILTVVAFLYFRERDCDYVILECGMGGLTDATNVIDHPLLSVITGVSLDHASFLGSTVAEIAKQKAGIIKDGCPVLWCGSDPEGEAECRRHALCHRAPLHTVPRGTLNIKQADLSGTVFDFNGKTDLPLSLLGLYQADNAANALTALQILNVNCSDDVLRRGLRNARWPGRFEVLSTHPLIIADGGHNPDGVNRAVESIEAYFPGERVVFVTGIMADKDYRTVAARMASVAYGVYTVTPPNARSLPAEDYAQVFRSLAVPATPCSEVKDALELAIAEGKPVVCLGSLYMYSEIRAALNGMKKI